ncbi:MAG: ABC transporter substrate-binding protein [Rhodobacteraceae bacterium]|nr:ABC transporter substrate-binding protein [Paracoccaceae bacterium]
MAFAAHARALEIRIAVLRADAPSVSGLPISRLDLPPPDLGFAGAQLGYEDNQTTGAFLGQTYLLTTRTVAPQDAAASLQALIADGYDKVVALAPHDSLLALSDAAGDAALLLNALAPDDDLRSGACRANILHVAPSRAMRADGLIQYLIWKQWRRVVLISGSHPEDRALADSYRAALAKFQARIVSELEFEDTGGARRTDTGFAQVQRQIPQFTQKLRDHDVIVAADEADVFAAYLPYRTWQPRPVTGSAGLRPVTFHPAHEAWGATQFQTRFEDLTGRRVREEDYQVWLALRVIGEAVTRTGSADPEALRRYALSDAFSVGGFKGQKLTFRPWNGQLRQPILLSDGHLTVSVSPQPGFLHQRSPLDTLGLDRPESRCTAFEPN